MRACARCVLSEQRTAGGGDEYGAGLDIYAYIRLSIDRTRHDTHHSHCFNPNPVPQQVYGGVKTEADAGLLKAVATKREGPVLKPLVLDVNKPESLQAAAAKVKAELGEVRFVGLGGPGSMMWSVCWVACSRATGVRPGFDRVGNQSYGWGSRMEQDSAFGHLYQKH